MSKKIETEYIYPATVTDPAVRFQQIVAMANKEIVSHARLQSCYYRLRGELLATMHKVYSRGKVISCTVNIFS